MASFNKVILAGHMTRDPEVRYTPKGTPVSQFGLGINRTWTADDGQKREEATFVEIEAWGKPGEIIGKFLKKGIPILIEGRLKLDSWEDKESGKKQNRLKVVLETFSFLDSRPGDAAATTGKENPSDDAPF